MRIRIRKWGNSLAIRIPKRLAKHAGLAEGMTVELYVANGRLVIDSDLEELTLEEMLAQITDENIHDEVDWSGPVGKEIW